MLVRESAAHGDFRLTRLLEWAGFDRKDFDYAESASFDPTHRARVVVSMGGVPSARLCGIHSILDRRGYVESWSGRPVVPTVDPTFIQRGQSKWSAPFINDIQKAVEIARHGIPPQFTAYTLDPSPAGAYTWARAYVEALATDPSIRCSIDIETPYKGEEEDGLDTDSDAPDSSWHIDRIGFAYRAFEALSIPWAAEYIPAIKLICGTGGDKVVWNGGFDLPRIRRKGVDVHGIIHDGMVAWHILHSDLPKRLGFVATFTCPWQPAWKHLSGARPAFYNATDNDVQLRSMQAIERELRAVDLWGVYTRDVIDLQPVLDHMCAKGMPVDAEVRLDRAQRLDIALRSTHERMSACVPTEARKVDHVYSRTPADTTGLLSRPGRRISTRCSVCGIGTPRKDHFKRFVKKINLCSDGKPVEYEGVVEEYYRLAEFTPSRDQLTRYHQHLKRPLPTAWDKKLRRQKVSFAEGNIRKLMLQYPLDKLYSTVLEYRRYEKLQGTYIGRPVLVESQ